MTIDKDHSTFQKQSSGGKPIAIVRITFLLPETGFETNSLALIRFVSRGIFSFSRNPLNFISAAVNPPFLIGLCPYRQQHRRQPTQQQLWSPTSSSRTYHNDIGQNTYHCSISSSARTPAGIELTSYSEKDTNSVQCLLRLHWQQQQCVVWPIEGKGAHLFPSPSPLEQYSGASQLPLAQAAQLPSARSRAPFHPEIDVTHFLPSLLSLQLPAPRELNPDLGRHIPDAQDPGHRLSPAGEP
ncbi:hypothetical protein HCEG_04680 [Histoplasma capsulatum var. duboisii H88]|uniref:Uncharacterized protein n=1 Tax=Ajellomyces capsulatus (strain H88) TaxID=544711 RepID=F0UHV6_AJEC8|nr:hypothetical protein HCEG_04680 [Histoplasma capsulatum var. duboisii H88]